MDTTKPCKFIGFGAMAKPYKFIGFGAMHATKPHKFIGFGAMDATKPCKFIGFGAKTVFLVRVLALRRPSVPELGHCA